MINKASYDYQLPNTCNYKKQVGKNVNSQLSFQSQKIGISTAELELNKTGFLRKIWNFIASAPEEDKCLKANDKKFSLSQAGKNFLRGSLALVTTPFKSTKNLLITGIGLGAGFLITVATGGAALPFMMAAGLTLGGGIAIGSLGYNTYKSIKTGNGDYLEKAFYNVGELVTTAGLTLATSISALKAAGISTEGLNPYTATIRCYKEAYNSLSTTSKMIKNGQAYENLANFWGSITKTPPVELSNSEHNPTNLHTLENPKDMDVFDIRRPVQTAIAGYSAPPEGYDKAATKFTNDLIGHVGKRNISITTSPTASGKIDAIDEIATVAARNNDVPVRYVTAQEYVPYIERANLPVEYDPKNFDAASKFVFRTPAEYSAATARASNSILVLGGRNASVSDYVNAIKCGNRAIIAKIPGPAAWDPGKTRVGNASSYLIEQIQHFGRTGTLLHPENSGLTLEFMQQNYDRIVGLTKIVDAVNDADAAIKAAHHLTAGYNNLAVPVSSLQIGRKLARTGYALAS